MPDRNQVTIVGVDLPAFLLSKNVSFRVHRNAPAVAETCLVGLTRLLGAISPSSSAFLTSFKESRQKIKNPASSAGHNRFFLAIPREAQQVLARVARKVPHSRILRLPYRSDRESPDRHKDFGKPSNRRSVYRNSGFRQVPVKTFFADFSSGLWMRPLPEKSDRLPSFCSNSDSLPSSSVNSN
jgi:hypothetical protein